MSKNIKCTDLINILPKNCPLKRQCEIFKFSCRVPNFIDLDKIPEEEEHDPPCHGGPCSGHCEIALEGGTVTILKPKKRKKK